MLTDKRYNITGHVPGIVHSETIYLSVALQPVTCKVKQIEMNICKHFSTVSFVRKHDCPKKEGFCIISRHSQHNGHHIGSSSVLPTLLDFPCRLIFVACSIGKVYIAKKLIRRW